MFTEKYGDLCGDSDVNDKEINIFVLGASI